MKMESHTSVGMYQGQGLISHCVQEKEEENWKR